MTYDEAIETIVSYDQARDEVLLHSCDWSEFLADNGKHPTYPGKLVLDWLGY